MPGPDEKTGLDLSFAVGRREVSARLVQPAAARSLLVLGHGAGAGMRHPFLEAVASLLAEQEVATLRYQFPYMEAGRRRPDPPPVLVATVRAAVAVASAAAPGLRLFAGGKSMGGRMTSTAAATSGLPEVRGLVFFGFPLHPAGKPSIGRGDHLDAVGLPMLFLQGDRDRLAHLELLKPVVSRLGGRVTLHVEAGADHGFHVLKRSGRSDPEVLAAVVERAAAWIHDLA